MNKKQRQKLVFISLGVLILIIFGIIIIKYLDFNNPENRFDFDSISPVGEFTDLQAADEESVLSE